jgi:hypothetical protein
MSARPRDPFTGTAVPELWRKPLWRMEPRTAGFLAQKAALALAWPLWRQYYRVFPRTFTFQERAYPYFSHPYNFTWSNERAVEIPVVWEAVGQCSGRVLEVGNVLSHYFRGRHEIVDKYERSKRVRNLDVLDLGSDGSGARYDLIVSISTLEHVGWDEQPRDPGKVIRAILHLADQLNPGGRLLATLPLGYNSNLDGLLAEGALPFTRISYLRRRSTFSWQEAGWDEVAGCRYGHPWPAASGLAIGEVRR